MIMWFELLKRIQDVLMACKVSAPVQLGAVIPQHADVDEIGKIMLVRGSEMANDESAENELLVTIYLEAWVRNDDPDLSVGYARISELEEQIDTALKQMRQAVGSLNEDICVLNGSNYQILDLKVKQKTGDLDALRPLLGSQYTIECRLFDLTREGGIY